MRVIANAAAFVVAIGVMGGLILAQRDYQISWHEQTVIQMPATQGTPAAVDQYKVVMK